jgi:hypothetical protein
MIKYKYYLLRCFSAGATFSIVAFKMPCVDDKALNWRVRCKTNAVHNAYIGILVK